MGDPIIIWPPGVGNEFGSNCGSYEYGLTQCDSEVYSIDGIDPNAMACCDVY
jgi:hypothetical protein